MPRQLIKIPVGAFVPQRMCSFGDAGMHAFALNTFVRFVKGFTT
jgi:hypothetical protein